MAEENHQRHPSTEAILRWFTYDHLPDPLRGLSQDFSEMAHHLVENLQDGPELTAGLRKLLEAKDCCVRQLAADLNA